MAPTEAPKTGETGKKGELMVRVPLHGAGPLLERGMRCRVGKLEDQAWRATILGDKDELKRLIRMGVDPNSSDSYGMTLLMSAVVSRQKECAAVLLDANAEVNLRNRGGWSAVQYAAEEGQLEILELLIVCDANPDIRNNAGETSLIRAAMYGRTEVAELLIRHGADVNAVDHEGRTALDYARMFEHPEIEMKLLRKDAKEGRELQ